MGNKKLIFVIGTGRSGTHLIGRTIASHEEIVGRIEIPDTFNLITSIATRQDFESPFLVNLKKQKLIRKLSNLMSTTNSHILEKSHPALWMVEYLHEHFSEALFIGVTRGVEPTVSSMLLHRGVSAWYKKLPQNKPNRFLGITKENADIFSDLTIEEKCALRWFSHKRELDRLNEKYPDNIQVINYEDFVINPEVHLKKTAVSLGVLNKFSPEKFDQSALHKWKVNLSADQLTRIRAIIRKYL